MTTTPDPKTVREIARTFLTDPDADELKYVVRSYIGYAGGAEHEAWCDAVRVDAEKATVTTTASWPDEQPQDERDAQLADLATELDAANDDAYEIADRASKYREEIMRLRARIRELEGAQAERDGAKTAPPLVCNSRLHPDFADGEDVRCELPDSHAWHRSGERKWTP